MFYLNYPESCVKVGTWIVVLTSEPAVLDIILKLVTMSEERIIKNIHTLSFEAHDGYVCGVILIYSLTFLVDQVG